MRETKAPVQSFGEFIKAKRLAANLSQGEVAMMANVSQGHICKIENGQKDPTLNVALRICDALGADINEFVQG